MGNTPQSGGLCLKLGFGARYFQPSSYDILVVFGITYIIINIWSSQISIPTCQVRVVRFYQGALPERPRPPPRPPPPPPRLSSSSSSSSSLPPPPVSPQPCLHQLPPALAPCQLFAQLFANSLRRLSAPSSLPTSQLSVHRWTSTWDRSSSVCTAGPQPAIYLSSSVCAAGPQPGTCPGQCALLDLNLGPAQLSVHRWTSTAK